MMPSLAHKLTCLILCILLLSKLHRCFGEAAEAASSTVLLEDDRAIPPFHGFWSAFAKFYRLIAGKRVQQAQEEIDIDAYGANSQVYMHYIHLFSLRTA